MDFSKDIPEDDSLNEIGELEEIGELDDTEIILLEKSDDSLTITDSIHISSWKKRFANIPIPSMIFDNTLKVLWHNSTFNKYFNSFNDSEYHHITDYFNNLKDIEILKGIYYNLTHKETGFSWQGRVTSNKKLKRSDIANLLISPLDLTESDIPQSFTGMLDMITGEYREMLRNMFSSLLEASKLKDNDTGNHIQRVNQYSKLLAEYLSMGNIYNEIDKDFIEDIGFLAAMHDVGKIGTPDDILNKAGSLEKWERDVMNEHTKNGAYILSTYPNPMAKQIALSHHEKWDGTGYPFGFSDTMIPLCARIVAIADVYDALRMKRSYKDSFSHKKAMNIILKKSKTHFDPNVVECFSRYHEDFNKIFSGLADSDKRG